MDANTLANLFTPSVMSLLAFNLETEVNHFYHYPGEGPSRFEEQMVMSIKQLVKDGDIEDARRAARGFIHMRPHRTHRESMLNDVDELWSEEKVQREFKFMDKNAEINEDMNEKLKVSLT